MHNVFLETAKQNIWIVYGEIDGYAPHHSRTHTLFVSFVLQIESKNCAFRIVYSHGKLSTQTHTNTKKQQSQDNFVVRFVCYEMVIGMLCKSSTHSFRLRLRWKMSTKYAGQHGICAVDNRARRCLLFCGKRKFIFYDAYRRD